MNRAELIRATDLAQAASHNVTLAMSYDRIRPDRAEHFANLAEEALYAALDAIAQARMTQPRSFLPVALEIAA